MESSRKMLGSVVLWLVTIGMMVCVVYFAWPTLRDALLSAEAAWWWWVVSGGLIVVNLLLVGAFWYLMHLPYRADRPVQLSEMTVLMVASGFMNLVPGPRLGLLGRSLYMKKVHGVAVRDSTMAMVWILVISGVVFPLACLPLVLGGVLGHVVWVGVMVALSWPAAGVVHRWLRGATGSSVLAVLLLRSVDVVAQAFRLMVAGELLGLTLSLETALAMGVIGLLTRLASITPNGLGLTEVVLAMSAVWLGDLEPAEMASVSLIDRAVETVVLTVAGGVCLGVLKKKWGASGAVFSEREGRDST